MRLHGEGLEALVATSVEDALRPSPFFGWLDVKVSLASFLESCDERLNRLPKVLKDINAGWLDHYKILLFLFKMKPELATDKEHRAPMRNAIK